MRVISWVKTVMGNESKGKRVNENLELVINANEGDTELQKTKLYVNNESTLRRGGNSEQDNQNNASRFQ